MRAHKNWWNLTKEKKTSVYSVVVIHVHFFKLLYIVMMRHIYIRTYVAHAVNCRHNCAMWHSGSLCKLINTLENERKVFFFWQICPMIMLMITMIIIIIDVHAVCNKVFFFFAHFLHIFMLTFGFFVFDFNFFFSLANGYVMLILLFLSILLLLLWGCGILRCMLRLRWC